MEFAQLLRGPWILLILRALSPNPSSLILFFSATILTLVCTVCTYQRPYDSPFLGNLPQNLSTLILISPPIPTLVCIMACVILVSDLQRRARTSLTQLAGALIVFRPLM